MTHRAIPTTLALAVIGLAAAAPGALAKHGADDGAAQHRHATQHRVHHHHHAGAAERRHGADDGPDHR